MDDCQVCNELFLHAVANQYALDFKKLKMGVLDAFTREEQEDIDPGGDYLRSTQHFDRFVKEHETKEVNVGIVVLYLKGVKMAVSHQELEDEAEIQNEKILLVRFVLSLSAGALFGLIFALKK